MSSDATKFCQDATDKLRRIDRTKIGKIDELIQYYYRENKFVLPEHAEIVRQGFQIKALAKTVKLCQELTSAERDFLAYPKSKDAVDDHLDAILNIAMKFELKLGVLNERFSSGGLLASEYDEAWKKFGEDYQKQTAEESAKMTLALQEIANGKTPKYGKYAQRRDSAKNDVVAQVLNYASGVPEDASGDTYFYPVNTENGQCVYKVAISSGMTNDVMNSLLQASKFMSANGIQGGGQTASVMEEGIDLNKGDLKNINFYKLQGAQRNKFTGATAYLRYQSRVEGLPDLFECDSNSCNIDRLKRGWALVASKCKGTKKAF